MKNKKLGKPGWLQRQYKLNKKQLKTWPKWMKEDGDGFIPTKQLFPEVDKKSNHQYGEQSEYFKNEKVED